MVDVYDSKSDLVLLDLSDMEDSIYRACQTQELDYDRTIFLNGVLTLLKHQHLVDQVLPRFLNDEMVEIMASYQDFKPTIRMGKLKRLSTKMKDVREIGFWLRDKFINHELYNPVGTLQIQAIDAEMLCASIASRGRSCLTKNIQPIFSISETPLEYLKKILISS